MQKENSRNKYDIQKKIVKETASLCVFYNQMFIIFDCCKEALNQHTNDGMQEH